MHELEQNMAQQYVESVESVLHSPHYLESYILLQYLLHNLKTVPALAMSPPSLFAPVTSVCLL